MSHPDDPDRVEEEIDGMAREAAAFLSAHHPWNLRAEDIMAMTRGHRPPTQAKTAVVTLLVAAAIIVVFVAPLPQLHVFGSGGSIVSSGGHGTTTTTVPVVAAGRLTYLAADFSGPQYGAVLDSVAPAKGTVCSLALYSTSDGAARWSGPLVFGHGAPCLDNLVLGRESLSVASSGVWWVAMSNELYTGTLGGQAATLVALPGGAQACSVKASASVVYVVTQVVGECTNSSTLVRSTDGGGSWSTVPSPPVTLVGSPFVPSVALPATGAVLAIGLPLTGRFPEALGSSLAVAQRTGDESWHSSVLPCKAAPGKTTDWEEGLVTSSGKRFVAACLGPQSGGTTGIEVVTSNDGGHTWSERCGFSLFSFGNSMNKCPNYGTPTGIAIAPTGDLVMSDDNVGLLVSDDDGITWRTVASPLGELPSSTFRQPAGGCGPSPSGPTPCPPAPGWPTQRTERPGTEPSCLPRFRSSPWQKPGSRETTPPSTNSVVRDGAPRTTPRSPSPSGQRKAEPRGPVACPVSGPTGSQTTTAWPWSGLCAEASWRTVSAFTHRSGTAAGATTREMPAASATRSRPSRLSRAPRTRSSERSSSAPLCRAH